MTAAKKRKTGDAVDDSISGNAIQGTSLNGELFTADTLISDVANDPVFGDYGRLIFPADAGSYSGDTPGRLRLTWYGNTDPNKTNVGGEKTR